MSKKLRPIHPGEQLREEFMIPLGLSSNALARALNVTPARINEIVRERRGITADTALRLARYFNTSHQFPQVERCLHPQPYLRPLPQQRPLRPPPATRADLTPDV